MIMAWIWLLIAGLAEIGWAVGLKLTDGWSRLGPSLVTLILIVISYVFLSLALRELPLGTAYAVWTGIGVIGTALIGVFFLNESKELLRFACIGLIVLGILGLKWFTR